MMDDRFGTHVQVNDVASSLRVSATTWPATAMTTRAGLHSIAIGPSGPGSLACFSFMFRSPPRLMSTLQELRGMLNKQLWVLVLRTMITVGVQDELRVQQVQIGRAHV